MTKRYYFAVAACCVVASLQLAVGADFGSWRSTHFPGSIDAALTGPLGNPDGDGKNNLMEYALGKDPKVPNAQILIPTVDATGHFVVSYTRPKGITDAFYVPEISSDLSDPQNWFSWGSKKLSWIMAAQKQ